jgi:hypothetical protein
MNHTKSHPSLYFSSIIVLSTELFLRVFVRHYASAVAMYATLHCGVGAVSGTQLITIAAADNDGYQYHLVCRQHAAQAETNLWYQTR